MQELFKGYYFNKNDAQAGVPEPAHNQSSQILLSGHTTTKTTSGVDNDQSPHPAKGKSNRQSVEGEIEEEV